jgi:hypothetical protein
LVELIKVCQLYLELQSDAATLAPRQRNEDPGGEPALLRRLQLEANEVQCLLPVDGQHVIGKPRYIRDQAFLAVVSFKRRADSFVLSPPQEWPAIRDPVARRQYSREGPCKRGAILNPHSPDDTGFCGVMALIVG